MGPITFSAWDSPAHIDPLYHRDYISGDCNLLRISTLTTPTTPTTAAFWWGCSILGGSLHGISHISGYILTHHGLKIHRIVQEDSLISSGKSQFSSRYSRPRARVPVVSINKLLVLRSIRPKYSLKFQTIRLKD